MNQCKCISFLTCHFTKTEAYSEPYQTTLMELFGEKLKTLDRVCCKLISRKLETNLRKLVLRDAAQFKARSQSQLKPISTGISRKSKNSRKYN